MKKLRKILNCLGIDLKKNFFNGQKSDIYHECGRALEFENLNDAEKEKMQIEEYLNNYNVTTRWQTV